MASFGRNSTFVRDNRRSVRVNERLPIRWNIQGESLTGTGKVCNISDSGLMIETPLNVLPKDNDLLSIESSAKLSADFLPPTGRIKWARKKPFGRLGSYWGVEFIEPSQEVISKLQERAGKNLGRTQNNKLAVNIVGYILLVALIGLTGFALLQNNDIRKSYEQSAWMLLNSTNQQANLYATVAKDLNDTKSILSETEALLAQVKEQNTALQNELNTSNAKLQAMAEENDRLTKEVTSLKDRLRPFEGEVGNLNEGKSFLQKVRGRYREIKLGIRNIKHQARLARIAAQKERDQLLLAQGNQGYLTKDSKPFTPSSPATPSQPAEKKIKINVDLF